MNSVDMAEIIKKYDRFGKNLNKRSEFTCGIHHTERNVGIDERK
ncbi:hypothetical protein [Cytobacillus spongiae]|nr:hypothetical protein [Cytobacillus spongiae]